jgi:3-oxoacyl-[acyl-carrier protein] reductase
MMTVESKGIVVVGAGGGMGREVIHQLLEAGARVVGCDVNVSSLEEFSSHKNFQALEGDFTKEDVVISTFRNAVDRLGKLDGLVNVAGIGVPATPVEEVGLSTYHKVMNINFLMVFLTCREAAKYMKPNNSGSIVNVGSVSTTRPRPGLQVYVASKGAVESFSKSIALELAEHKIRVNTLHPGPSDTNLLKQMTGEGLDIEEVKENVYRKSVPLGSLIEPVDIAYSIKHLLSDESRAITGAVLHVDGGRSI